MKRPGPLGFVHLLLSLTLACLVGCQSLSTAPLVPIDSTSGYYDRARLEYRLDAGKLNVPLSVAQIEGQLVSYQQVSTLPHPDQSLGTLEVIYPHPAGDASVALARVTILSRPPDEGKSSGTARLVKNLNDGLKKVPLVNRLASRATALTEEVWELDVPKGVVDQIVADLNHHGFFDRDKTAALNTELSARIDGRTVAKGWQQVPQLDRLMLVVRSRGRLIRYQRSGPPTTDRTAAPESVAAYRAYAAEDGSFNQMPGQHGAGGPAYPGLSGNPALMAGAGAFAQAPAARAFSPGAVPAAGPRFGSLPEMQAGTPRF